MTLIQKTDLAAASFANNNTAGAGGISIRVDNGSTVKTAIDAALAGIGAGVTLTDTAPSTSSTTAATPNFVNAAIAAAGAGGGVTLTNTAPSTSSTTAATPAFVNAAVAAAVPAASTSTAGVVTLTNTAPSTSATTAATPAFVNAAIAAAGAGGGVTYATDTEIRNGTAGNKVVTADVLKTALTTGVDYRVRANASVTDGSGVVVGVNTATSTTGANAGYFEITAAGSTAGGTANGVLGIVSNSTAGSETAGVFGQGYGEAHGVRGGTLKSSGVNGMYYGAEGSAPANGYSSGVFAVNFFGANVPALVAAAQGTGAGSNGKAIYATTAPSANCTTVIDVNAGGNTTYAITTNKAIQVAGTVVTSDSRLKRDITDISGARALAFIKKLKAKSYTKVQSDAAVRAAYAMDAELAQSELSNLQAELSTMPSVRDGVRVAEILRRIAILDEKVKGAGVIPDSAFVLGKEVGFIAQEVKALTDEEFPEFSHLVSLSDPKDEASMLVLDYNSLNVIIFAGMQHSLFA